MNVRLIKVISEVSTGTVLERDSRKICLLLLYHFLRPCLTGHQMKFQTILTNIQLCYPPLTDVYANLVLKLRTQTTNKQHAIRHYPIMLCQVSHQPPHPEALAEAHSLDAEKCD